MLIPCVAASLYCAAAFFIGVQTNRRKSLWDKGLRRRAGLSHFETTWQDERFWYNGKRKAGRIDNALAGYDIWLVGDGYVQVYKLIYLRWRAKVMLLSSSPWSFYRFTGKRYWQQLNLWYNSIVHKVSITQGKLSWLFTLFIMAHVWRQVCILYTNIAIPRGL